MLPPVETRLVPAAGDAPSEPPRLARMHSPAASVEVCVWSFSFLASAKFLLGGHPI